MESELRIVSVKEERKWYADFFFPVYFVCVMWLAKFAELTFNFPLKDYGIIPRKVIGLKGLIFMVFIHNDFEHLIGNSFPILLLSCALFYFYRTIAYAVFFNTILFSALGTWFIGREAVHIGASGLVYGLAFFIFFSGLIRKHTGLMAVSLLVVFLYGGLIWFMLPLVKSEISWEGHLSGAITGSLLAVIYRKKGVQKHVYDWEQETEEEEEEDNEVPLEVEEQKEPVKIIYLYKPSDPQTEDKKETK